jgi:hypothetical protein
VRLLHLQGLSANAGHALLQARGLNVSLERALSLTQHYSGSPLALQIIAEAVKDTFAGNLEAFLGAGALIFDDIRDMLDQQWARLTPLEQELLRWLAIEREPVSHATLQADLLGAGTGSALLEALRSLRRRSLIEQRGEFFALQNVVIEYVTWRLTDTVVDEPVGGSEDGRL